MLERRLRLFQAVSLNMSMMVGIGPFITIPALVATLNGPQSMIGWILGAAVALADGMVWSELAAAFPGSGGTYHFYDAAYGESPAGRLLKFVFVWQFLFSGPLEIATGAIGMANYLAYYYPGLADPGMELGNTYPRPELERHLGPACRSGDYGDRDRACLSANRPGRPIDGRALGRNAGHSGLGDRHGAYPVQRGPGF